VGCLLIASEYYHEPNRRQKLLQAQFNDFRFWKQLGFASEIPIDLIKNKKLNDFF